MYETLNLGSQDEPESKSDNPFTCVRCEEDFDLDDDAHSEDSEGYVCEECRYRCVKCGGPCGDSESHDCRDVGGDKICLPCFAFARDGEED